MKMMWLIVVFGSVFETESCCVAQAGPKGRAVLLPLILKCWNYKCLPPCMVLVDILKRYFQLQGRKL